MHEAVCASASSASATWASTTRGSWPRCPDVELVGGRRLAARAGPGGRRQVGTPGRRRLPRAPRPGRRRLGRRADGPPPRGRRGVPGAGHRRRWSRSRWPARWPRPRQLVALARDRGGPPGRPHRAVQPRPLGPRADCRSAPSTSTAERLSTYTFRSTDIGVVLDLMIHDIDLVLSLVPAPVRSVVGRGREPLRRARGRRQRPDRVRGRHASPTSPPAGPATWRCGRCGSGAPRATPRSTSPPSRPPSSARRRSSSAASSTSTGVDLGQPAAVKEHLFGKVLRVDQVQTAGREPLALELEDFVRRRPGRVAAPGRRRRRPAGHAAGRPGPPQPQRPPLGRRRDAPPAPAPARRDRLGPRGPHAWRTKGNRMVPWPRGLQVIVTGRSSSRIAREATTEAGFCFTALRTAPCTQGRVYHEITTSKSRKMIKSRIMETTQSSSCSSS